MQNGLLEYSVRAKIVQPLFSFLEKDCANRRLHAKKQTQAILLFAGIDKYNEMALQGIAVKVLGLWILPWSVKNAVHILFGAL